jgi:wyosine [tRNA(Phe)-imidazoG37] synthetase (radical SAM superfamily)
MIIYKLKINCELEHEDYIEFEFYVGKNDMAINIFNEDEGSAIIMNKEKIDEIIKYLNEIRNYMK